MSGTATIARAIFDLNAGTVAQTLTGSAAISDAGGGWYRCSVTGVADLAASTCMTLLDNGSGNAASSTVYSGDGASGVYLYGAMLNEGATALAYDKTMDIAATKDPQYGWAYHLQLGSSSASDTNDPTYLTNLLDPDATDDYVMIPLHFVDRDEWTIIVVAKSITTTPATQRPFGVRYDALNNKSVHFNFLASTNRASMTVWDTSTTTVTNISAASGWANATWALCAISFNRLSGVATGRFISAGALSTAQFTGATGLSTPDVARILNAANGTGNPMDGGGAYALVYNRALSDAEFLNIYKYIQQAKSGTVVL